LIDTIHGDDGYYELSQSIMQGDGMAENPLRPPLWPGTIALIASVVGYWGVLIFQFSIASLIPILGMRLAGVLIGEKYEKYVGWLMVISPYTILLSFILYSETAFTFLFLSSLIFLFSYIDDKKTKFIVLSSVFLGLSTLVKPTVQFFPIIIPIALLFIFRKEINKKILYQLFLYVAIFLLILAPWFYRNYRVFGVWGIGAQPAFNLYIYLVPTVLSLDNNTNFKTEYEKFVKKDGFDETTINLTTSDYFKDKALEEIRNHKVALIKSIFITVITFFTHDGMLTFLQYCGLTLTNIISKPMILLLAEPVELLSTVWAYAKTPAIFIILMRLAWFAISALFIFGIYKYFRKIGAKPLFLLSIMIVMYFAATTSINGLGVNARFRVPVEVFIFSFAVYGFFDIKERRKI
jgi:4-amino-4-deoxy-L-arabinose transferase-like glycosyltransferase